MTKKDAISIVVSQQQIMEHIYGCAIIPKLARYRNITRIDSTPTCSFFSRGSNFYLNDFRTGEILNPYDIIMRLNNCSFSEALDYVISVFMINTKSDSNIKIVRPAPIKEVEIQYQSVDRSYDINDKEFWQRFEITRPTLLKYKVRPVSEVSIFKRNKGKFEQIYNYDKSEDSICYKINVDNKIRFYKPKSDNRAYKWFGTTNAQCCFGYKELDIGMSNVIFICSGLKDMLCLNEMGFAAVAPMGEGIPLPENVIAYLKDLKKYMNKRIVYLFDTDIAGLKAAAKFACINGFEAIWLPKQPDAHLKDVAEYVEYFGKDSTKTIIKTLLKSKIKWKLQNYKGLKKLVNKNRKLQNV